MLEPPLRVMAEAELIARLRALSGKELRREPPNDHLINAWLVNSTAWPGWNTISCFAGSSASASTTRLGPFGVSKNRDRLLEGDIAAKFLNALLAQPKVKKLLSTDHFSVDGTLIEAWASMKSFKPKDGSDEPPSGGGGQRGGLPWPEALERDACLEH